MGPWLKPCGKTGVRLPAAASEIGKEQDRLIGIVDLQDYAAAIEGLLRCAKAAADVFVAMALKEGGAGHAVGDLVDDGRRLGDGRGRG